MNIPADTTQKVNKIKLANSTVDIAIKVQKPKISSLVVEECRNMPILISHRHHYPKKLKELNQSYLRGKQKMTTLSWSPILLIGLEGGTIPTSSANTENKERVNIRIPALIGQWHHL